MSHIHVGRDGTRFGPYSETLARSLFAQGTITGDDLIWREGFESWRPASVVFGVAITASHTPAIEDAQFAHPGTIGRAVPSFLAAPPSIGKQVLWMEHPTTQEVRRAPWGFSWTTLVFGPIVPLVRRDMPGFWVSLPLAVITGGFTNLVFAFLGNKQYIKRLAALGYRAAAVETGSLDGASAALEFQLPIAAGAIPTGPGTLRPDAQTTVNSVSKVRMTWIAVGVLPIVALGVSNPTKYAADPFAGTTWNCGKFVEHYGEAGELTNVRQGDPTGLTPWDRMTTRHTGIYKVEKGAILFMGNYSVQSTTTTPSDMPFVTAMNNLRGTPQFHRYKFEISGDTLTLKRVASNGQVESTEFDGSQCSRAR